MALSHNLSTTPVVLTHPFRAFFVVCGLYALVLIVAWMAFIFGGWPIPIGWSPAQWHSHELLYGFVTAAIPGFLLTAITNWTGARPLQGINLLLLLLLWLSGRVAMWFASWLPEVLVAIVDLSFLPVLAGYVAWVLIRYKNYRNLILIAVLCLLFIGNLLMHIGFVTHSVGLLLEGQQMGFNLITVLIVIIAGRITPAFTANWFRAQGGNPDWVWSNPWVEKLSLGSMVIIMVADWTPLPSRITGSLVLFACIVNSVRLAGWAGWRTQREPLVWILHVAYLWLVVALLFRGLSAFTDLISPTVWQHMLGIGGFATLILGVMTRVAVGHTGRPLHLLKFGLGIYLSIIGSAILRVLAAAGITDYGITVSLSAFLWVLAFGLFTALYAPVLARPRVDGRPG